MHLSMLDTKTAKARFHGNFGTLTLIATPDSRDEKVVTSLIFFSLDLHNLTFFKELLVETSKVIDWIETQKEKEAPIVK